MTLLQLQQQQKHLQWRLHYLVFYKTTRRINNRKKDTPDNLRVVWTTEAERFASVEDAINFATSEEITEYKIYRIEPTLVEEAL